MAQLDTLRAVKELTDAGADEALAEAIVRVVVEAAAPPPARKLVTGAVLYRALLVQGGGIIGATAGIMAILLALFEAF